MANWQTFEIQVPGKDFLEPTRNVLETLLIFLEVLKAILDTIKVFLVDFGNPVRALVETLIALIEELFLSLKRSGVYAYFDVPNPAQDPNFDQHSGGFQAFSERFKASLFDEKDFSRPQPRAGSTRSGFVLLVVDASSPFALIARVKTLLRFFGREFTSPRFEAPDNVRAIPVGAAGDPIFAVASVFSEGPVEAIQLKWSLPSSVETPDPGFSDVVARTAQEFIPPKFLIERSTINPASSKIDISDMGSDKSGLVEFDRVSNFQLEGRLVSRRETLVDTYGDPVLKFEKYIVLDQTDIEAIVGQLGTFRYIDTDVVPDRTYYYRVRAFSGNLKMRGSLVDFPTSAQQLNFSTEFRTGVMQWPSTSDGEEVVVGKPSGTVSAVVPVALDPGEFDVVANLRAIYLSAFSLDFHLPPEGASPSQVGRGSLTPMAGQLAAFQAFPLIGELAREETLNESFQPNPILGRPPEMPWQKYNVRRHSARLADAAAAALLQAGSPAVYDFRNLMTDPLPAGPVDTEGSVSGVTTLEQLVLAFTGVEADGTVTLEGARAFRDGYSDEALRQNVLSAIQYLNNFSGTGAPPDWISVAPLRDIVPWAGQILYDLLDKIRALLDAFRGVADEINAFISLLERKIEALERFIEFLLNILTLVESLQVGAYVLSVTGVTGTAHDWAREIDLAGGARPPNNPGGYSAGVALAYVATDVEAFEDAFSIIFG